MPFLVADVSAHQGDAPNFGALAEKCVGVILKATQGTHYHPSWFAKNWRRARNAGGARYGTSWFRGAYHYLEFDTDGAAQADYFLDAIEAAGGWGAGDMHVFVDVEWGNPDSGNEWSAAQARRQMAATTQQIIACVTSFANRIKLRSGRKTILYGRGVLRDRRITSRMGCAGVWNAGYTAKMPLNGLEGWSADDVVLWQYTDGDGYQAQSLGLPRLIEAFGQRVDLNVVVDGPRKVTLDTVRSRLVHSRIVTILACVGLVLAALLASRLALH
jgi:GH25 family lysozyme M1 (1,4-beta-N-acetylmuramidase)